MKDGITKMSFNIDRKQEDQLRTIAKERGVSLTEVILDGVSLQWYLREEVANGAKVVVKRSDGDRELVFVR